MPDQTNPTMPVVPSATTAGSQAGQTTNPVITTEPDIPPIPPDFQNIQPPPPPASSAAPNDLPSVITPAPKKKFGGGRIIATILGLLLLVGGVGAGLLLTQQQQLFRPKASSTCTSCLRDANKACECSSECGTPACGSSEGGGGGGGGGGNPQPTPYCSHDHLNSCQYGCTPDLGGGTCNATPISTPPSTSNLACKICQLGSCVNTHYSSCNSAKNGCSTNADCTSTNGNGGGGGSSGACSPNGQIQNCTVNGVQGVQSCQNGQWGTCSDSGCTMSSCYSERASCLGQGRNFCQSASATGFDYTCCVAGYTCAAGGGCVQNNTGCTGSNCGSTTTSSAQCSSVTAYDAGWSPLTSSQLSVATVGETINFCVGGNSSAGGFDKAKFTINGSAQAETTTKGSGAAAALFCQAYVIPSGTTSFNVKAQIHDVTLGWSN